MPLLPEQKLKIRIFQAAMRKYYFEQKQVQNIYKSPVKKSSTERITLKNKTGKEWTEEAVQLDRYAREASFNTFFFNIGRQSVLDEEGNELQRPFSLFKNNGLPANENDPQAGMLTKVEQDERELERLAYFADKFVQGKKLFFLGVGDGQSSDLSCFQASDPNAVGSLLMQAIRSKSDIADDADIGISVKEAVTGSSLPENDPDKAYIRGTNGPSSPVKPTAGAFLNILSKIFRFGKPYEPYIQYQRYQKNQAVRASVTYSRTQHSNELNEDGVRNSRQKASEKQISEKMANNKRFTEKEKQELRERAERFFNNSVNEERSEPDSVQRTEQKKTQPVKEQNESQMQHPAGPAKPENDAKQVILSDTKENSANLPEPADIENTKTNTQPEISSGAVENTGSVPTTSADENQLSSGQPEQVPAKKKDPDSPEKKDWEAIRRHISEFKEKMEGKQVGDIHSLAHDSRVSFNARKALRNMNIFADHIAGGGNSGTIVGTAADLGDRLIDIYVAMRLQKDINHRSMEWHEKELKNGGPRGYGFLVDQLTNYRAEKTLISDLEKDAEFKALAKKLFADKQELKDMLFGDRGPEKLFESMENISRPLEETRIKAKEEEMQRMEAERLAKEREKVEAPRKEQEEKERQELEKKAAEEKKKTPADCIYEALDKGLSEIQPGLFLKKDSSRQNFALFAEESRKSMRILADIANTGKLPEGCDKEALIKHLTNAVISTSMFVEKLSKTYIQIAGKVKGSEDRFNKICGFMKDTAESLIKMDDVSRLKFLRNEVMGTEGLNAMQENLAGIMKAADEKVKTSEYHAPEAGTQMEGPGAEKKGGMQVG